MSYLAIKVMCKWLSALQSSWCLCLVGDCGDLGVVAVSVCFDAADSQTGAFGSVFLTAVYFHPEELRE